MRLERIFLVFVFVALATAAEAQNGRTWTNSPRPPNAPAMPTTVKSAPFSADVITLYDRVLDNGNHIHRDSRGKVFRDAQGRVRTETESVSPLRSDKFQHITIQDPLQHVVIHLDPESKTATIHHLGETTSAAAGARETAPPAGTGNAILLAPQAGQSASRSTSVPLQHSKTSSAHTEALGMRTIEGVLATGTKISRTMADAGSQVIVSITESWFSRDLQMIVLTETDDGEGGHSTMKLVDIVRADPDPHLFEVPSDYVAKETNPATASTDH
jgi:hypothetical protein